MCEAIDLCYVLSHGFSVRMVLHSDLLGELRGRGLSVALVVPNASEGSMQDLARRYGVALVQAPPTHARRLAEYSIWRRYMFEDHRTNPALRARHEGYLARWRSAPLRALRAAGLGAIGPFVQRTPMLKRGMDAIERWVLRDTGIERVLADLRPRVLVATYPVDLLDACFLFAARSSGIPSVVHLLSWDNITSKGRFPVTPDYFITWGPIMTEEAQAYYDVPEHRIYGCGVPHFDRHVKAPTEEGRTRVLRGLGLDPEGPYLFYGMSSPVQCPREIDIVEWLAELVCDDAWGADLQLVIRPHPQNMEGHMADRAWLPRLDALGGDRVAIDYPALQSDSSLAWNMQEDDLDHLSNLTSGCAVCLNAGSTLAIDALMHNKPVILTAFDAGERLPWWNSARRVVDYVHLRKLVETGGVAVASGFAELRDCIERYLADPAVDAAGRMRALDRECGPADGQASRRVADALHTIVELETLGTQPAGRFDAAPS